MEIYIKGNLPKGSKKGVAVNLRLPALPQKISIKSAMKVAEYQIMELGTVNVPNGNELTIYSWEGMLPGAKRKGAPWIRGKWIDPKTIQNYFTVWKNKGVRLQLIITGTPIKQYVYLTDFEITYDGGCGDYSYVVNFKEAKQVTVKISKAKVKRFVPTVRTTKSKGKKYKIKSGDCLWKISKKFYGKGNEYMKIYKANKSVIEKAAKKHGRSSSSNGTWIYVGTTLTIP